MAYKMIFSILLLLTQCSTAGLWGIPRRQSSGESEGRLIVVPQEECSYHEVWITAIHEEECGKADGITASGEIARRGMIAADWLPFGTEGRNQWETCD